MGRYSLDIEPRRRRRDSYSEEDESYDSVMCIKCCLLCSIMLVVMAVFIWAVCLAVESNSVHSANIYQNVFDPASERVRQLERGKVKAREIEAMPKHKCDQESNKSIGF